MSWALKCEQSSKESRMWTEWKTRKHYQEERGETSAPEEILGNMMRRHTAAWGHSSKTDWTEEKTQQNQPRASKQTLHGQREILGLTKGTRDTGSRGRRSSSSAHRGKPGTIHSGNFSQPERPICCSALGHVVSCSNNVREDVSRCISWRRAFIFYMMTRNLCGYVLKLERSF